MARERVKLRDLPALTPEALDALDTYYGEVIEQCRAAARIMRRAARQNGASFALDNAQYWRHAAGAIKWLRGQVRQTRTATGRKGRGWHGTQEGGPPE